MNKLKISCDGQTRRITLTTSPPELVEVKNFIDTIYPHVGNYNLTYVDEDEDKVLVDTDGELREAFVVMENAGKSILRLDLEPQQPKQPKSPSEEQPPCPRPPFCSPRPAPPFPLPQNQVVHPAFCDGCDKRIIGVRYKCEGCFDFDFCETCKGPCPHDASHTFRAIRGHCWPFSALPIRSFLVLLAILLLLPCTNKLFLLGLSPFLCPAYVVAKRKMNKQTFYVCFGLFIALFILSFRVWIVLAILSAVILRNLRCIRRFICKKRHQFREYRRKMREERRKRAQQYQEQLEKEIREEEERRKMREERLKEAARREEERKEEVKRALEEVEKKREEERERKLKEAERKRMEALSALVGMGFGLKDSTDALDAVGNNNINAAVDKMVMG
mmetsp:Transcript_12336/g.18838  ORF Transcript_12336/g.18838 Transcript_12336/m.18838 type:complete len:388 (-) Transcript_12336:83-1246(-)